MAIEKPKFGHVEGETPEHIVESAKRAKESLEAGEVLPNDRFRELVDNGYGWLAARFPEGFEDVDSKEMKELLEAQEQE